MSTARTASSSATPNWPRAVWPWAPQEVPCSARRCTSTACCGRTRNPSCRSRLGFLASCATSASESATPWSRSTNSPRSRATRVLPHMISRRLSAARSSRGKYRSASTSEQKPAFVVADLSTIWVDLSVYRHDFKRVRIGDEVLIDPDDGGENIMATISYVPPGGASDTQTALARAVLTNPDGRLRPGLFVTARLVLAKRNARVAVRVGAIQTLEDKTVVFVREGDKIEARPVLIGESDAQHAE